jgi:hypothetical protein
MVPVIVGVQGFRRLPPEVAGGAASGGGGAGGGSVRAAVLVRAARAGVRERGPSRCGSRRGYLKNYSEY